MRFISEALGHRLRQSGRRKQLRAFVKDWRGIQVGSYVEERGIELYELAKERGFEGIIAKRKSSNYQPGRRSPDWLKIKARLQQEFVIGGFTEGIGSRAKNFGALLHGAYTNEKPRYCGHSGSGFSDRALAEMMDRLL